MKILVDKNQIQDAIEWISLAMRYLKDINVVKHNLSKATDELYKIVLHSPIVTETLLEDEINHQLASYNPWAGKKVEIRHEGEGDTILDEAIKAINTPDNNWEPGAQSGECDLYPSSHEITTALVRQKQWTLEIIDIMMDSNCSRGWNRSTVTETRLKALKVKLVDEK